MEICVAMIAACAHALRPLFKAVLKDSTMTQYKAYHSRGRSTQRTGVAREPHSEYDLEDMVMHKSSNASREERDVSPGMNS